MPQEDLTEFVNVNGANDSTINRPFNSDPSPLNEFDLHGYIQDIKTNYIDMRVPDKILVVGSNTYAEATGPPHETAFENEIMSSTSKTYLPIDVPEVLTLNDFSMSENKVVTSHPVNNHEESKGVFAPENKISDKHTNLDISMDNMDNNQLHQELIRLNRNVTRIEKQFQDLKKQNRILLYIGYLYIALKFISWIRN